MLEVEAVDAAVEAALRVGGAGWRSWPRAMLLGGVARIDGALPAQAVEEAEANESAEGEDAEDHDDGCGVSSRVGARRTRREAGEEGDRQLGTGRVAVDQKGELETTHRTSTR